MGDQDDALNENLGDFIDCLAASFTQDYEAEVSAWEHSANNSKRPSNNQNIALYLRAAGPRPPSSIDSTCGRGAHQLGGRFSRSNANEDRPTQHWICLSGVGFRRTAHS